MIAVILSVLFPGLGQFYFGKIFKGILMMLLALTFLYPVALIWSVWDAWKLKDKASVDPAFRRETLKGLTTLFVAIPLIVVLIFLSGYVLINPFVKKSKTKNELIEISTALEQYFATYKSYPENLNSITINRPLRKDWTRDAWNNKYSYSLSETNNGYRITSAGKDGKMGTDDDILP